MKPLKFTLIAVIAISSCTADYDFQQPAQEPENKEIAQSNNPENNINVTITDVNKLLTNGRLLDSDLPKSRSNKSDYNITPIVVDNDIVAYAVNYVDGGWALLSSSKPMGPVLAHSPYGSFNGSNIDNTGLSIWLNEVSKIEKYRETLPSDSTFANINHWDVLLDNKSFNPAPSAQNYDPDTEEMYQMCIRRCHDAINEAGKKGFRELYFGGEQFSTDEELCNSVWEFAKYNVCPAFEEDWQNLCFLVVVDDFTNETLSNVLPIGWGQEMGFNMYFPEENGTLPPAGCGPVAMGQLMYFYKYPETFRWDYMDPYFADWYNAQLLWDIAQRAGTKNGKTDLTKIVPTLESYGYDVKEVYNIFQHLKMTQEPAMLTGYDKECDKYHSWLASGYKHKAYTQYYYLYCVTSAYIDATPYEVYKEFFYDNLNYWLNWGGYEENTGFYPDFSFEDEEGVRHIFTNVSALSITPKK